MICLWFTIAHMMIMEHIFKVSHEQECKNANYQYHTRDDLANNGQRQTRLTNIDFVYYTNKWD